MTVEEKRLHVDNILEDLHLFDDLIGLPRDVLDFRPSPDRWTIHEHLIHCLDVDVANFTRYRVGIVHPGSEIIGMDDDWTAGLLYETISPEEAIETIKLIRKMTHRHLSAVVDDDWTQYSILYKKYGILDFETFIPVMHKHPKAHREFIDKLLGEYNSAV
ncbi:MAG: DinB family protein [Spirochaetales bacterium]|nr:DinB family protein [Spirochaetales bacterium]